MARFNFLQITGRSRVSIADIMNNFNKIESLGITEEEVNTLVNDIQGTEQTMNNKINTNTTNISNLQTNKQNNISVGLDAPTSQTQGNIYIQYFETEE